MLSNLPFNLVPYIKSMSTPAVDWSCKTFVYCIITFSL
ncbi:hypothetical protein GYO_0823 [Bacillus spizizenii TU-B-10]|uniref:Uncharacterized protein n=1 Tax=Bacillus spizizenii (strain DSM 15029 / JCM 12233 / NBRC 101239 / NRRL B-23049 / TU-B-10) TaxID=1052585 RepID=G4NR46_BACS4|nr:hypothetical protein GYO_0823 [Bacillus spizizenii TU-B-10]SCV39547.1 hypothetical protein BQ1740_1013 [Bacillus subtilis]